MDKNEVLSRISAVMKTLDGGIEVSGVKNAGNLAACYAILEEVIQHLANCNILMDQPQDDNATSESEEKKTR